MATTDTQKAPKTPESPQWPLGWPLEGEKARGYVIPSGNHHEWPLEPLEPPGPPGPPRPLGWPIGLPEVPHEP